MTSSTKGSAYGTGTNPNTNTSPYRTGTSGSSTNTDTSTNGMGTTSSSSTSNSPYGIGTSSSATDTSAGGTNTIPGTGMISRPTLGTSADINDSTGVGRTGRIPYDSTGTGGAAGSGSPTLNTGTASRNSTSFATPSPRKTTTEDHNQSTWSILGMFALVGLTIGLAHLFRRRKPEESVGKSEDIVEDSFNQ